MFLKRIELNGFKSFADRTVISFEDPVTGIVGPNGCGKSNITDAIRWVLGEQSVNSLRGDKNMSSIIFSGSSSHRTVSAAEVSLVFDNSQRVFDSEFEEIEIKRRIVAKDSSSEYYINKTECRLKDILDLTMDSGIGKDSLNIISQGNISAFADAKPDARRAIFEEAAGVSKYKKKKTEAISRLTTTQNNLERVSDILEELENQILPLANAAKKAEKYSEMKERLETIETSVLVSNIEFYTNSLTESKQQLFDSQTESALYQTSIGLNENDIAQKKEQINSLDSLINKDQQELIENVQKAQSLETRRIGLEEKRKYRLEQGNSQERAVEIRRSLNEAKTEYLARKKAYEDIQTEIRLKEEEQRNIILDKIDIDQEYNQETNALKIMENRKSVVDNLLTRPFMRNEGVQAIMDAQACLPGVLGCVATELVPDEGYEEAISVALGGALYNIVTENPESARTAINYLKRNQSGRATFLPKSVLNPRFISEQDEIIVQNQAGYLGIACDFVENKKVFDVVRDYLLGTVIICDTLLNAQNIADLLKYRYNTVTLDGEIIHRGGSLTGGKQKNSNSYLSLRKEADNLDKSIASKKETVDNLTAKRNAADTRKTAIDNRLWELRVNGAKQEPIVDIYREKYENLQAEYQLLDIKEDEDTDFDDELSLQVAALENRKNELETALRINRAERMRIKAECDRKEQQTNQLRHDLHENEQRENNINIDITRLEILRKQDVDRLNSEYHLTYEFAKEKVNGQYFENAKEEVATLRKKIAALGNVNLDAPKEYEEKSERFEKLSKNYDELNDSRERLLNSIAEMDEIMKERFMDMFDRINAEFSKVFLDIFKGGKARLYLEDPADILNSGVEIEAHPPGKVIKNNRILSGGEKTLVAFCVLFAIIRSRTVPICIFDEVDTALDPANNERFADYVRSVSDTQFVIITHHPATMVKCDTLYGVTMAQDGVSSILKVQMNEAQKIVEGA